MIIKYKPKDNSTEKYPVELSEKQFENKKISVFEFPALNKLNIVRHLFTTRIGGASEGIYSTMNLSYTRGDNKEAVDENFRRIAGLMGKEPKDIICSNQTHTTNVLRVNSSHGGNGVTKPNEFIDVDGMITNERGIVLATFYADCVPLYFVDPVKKAIGLSHSGWKGTVGRIGKVTVEKMEREFGSRPENIVCAIGPSICFQCYEVSSDVAYRFEKEFKDKSYEILTPKENTGGDKYLLNLWRANEIVLEEAGIKKTNIHTTNVCTCCNDGLLFSHRASQGKRGNLGAFLCLE